LNIRYLAGLGLLRLVDLNDLPLFGRHTLA
jgi:hypothetical protein